MRVGGPQQRLQDSQFKGFMQGGAGRLAAASSRAGQAARSSECTKYSKLKAFKAVRAGCRQQRMHPRFPIGKLQGGAGRPPARANAPKIPNWKASCKAVRASCQKASKQCEQAARSSERTQDFQLGNASRRRAGRLRAAAKAPKIRNWKA